MTDVVLVYPYFFNESKDRSIFKYPPLGLGYLASSLLAAGYSVEIVDGSYSTRREVLARIRELKPTILGFYCMMTMEQAALSLGSLLKEDCQLLVTGGPYPSADPAKFLGVFDLAVIGEGERTMVELADAVIRGRGDPLKVPGVAYRHGGEIKKTRARKRIENLDELPFPARDLFDNEGYKKYWRREYGYTVTSMMTTRGCPYSCGFCSKPVFGSAVKKRSAENVLDELEDIARRGYDRVWMGDDCFTIDDQRTIAICRGMIERGLNLTWECLSRVDGVNADVLDAMRDAGCARLFFGLESGDDRILRAMNKRATFADGKAAIELASRHGLKTGAFFILGYPGETNESLTRTVNASSSLPLDYLSYTVPYPLPGTDLYEKVKDRLKAGAWTSPRRHSLLYKGDFSILKLKVAMGKGLSQHALLKSEGWPARLEPSVRKVSDGLLRLIR
jgi:anaerobic magnesium-protoporphyrin IX monomethyl ester cyclase